MHLLSIFAVIIVARVVEPSKKVSVVRPHVRARTPKPPARPAARLDVDKFAKLTGLSPPAAPCTGSPCLMEPRIVPVFKDGVAWGFKLFSIRPDSVYAKVGIENGDVLRRINGYDLDSPERVLEVYSRLRDACHFDIFVERNGSNIHLTNDIPCR